jgi:ubiquinone/menaquinone biosynthesis C-methylase UbiE
VDPQTDDPRTRQSVAAYGEAAEHYQQQWGDRRPLDAVRRFAALAGRGARVLDVAAGPALDMRVLRDAGLRVVAGDLAGEAVALAKMLHPKGLIARWDLRRLPFGSDVFSGVWAPAALQHLPRAGIRPALAELRRVHAAGPIFVTFREGAGDLEPVDDPPTAGVYATTVTADELRALLLDAGYTQVEVESRPDPLGRADVTWLYGWGILTS